jgi:hypothetical protein
VKTLILLFAVITIEYSQERTDSGKIVSGSFSIGNNSYEELYRMSVDSVFTVQGKYFMKLLAERDSLKHSNLYLKTILRIYIENSIDVNKAFLQSGIVNPDVVKKSLKIDKDILKELK